MMSKEINRENEIRTRGQLGCFFGWITVVKEGLNATNININTIPIYVKVLSITIAVLPT